ncbi:oxygenase MpaB family protein [Runella zeae]|uniref:oxygenase MpaB family protein n=1 Tax=Runella zeae TaxID=94255 RepID=UPI000428290E|nr:oxygenase MpaB family protein [Runella zeae]
MTSIPTSRIFDDNFLSPYRQQGDPAADRVIAQLAQDQGREGLGRFMRYLGDFQDLSTSQWPAYVKQFFEEHQKLPAFADSRQMQQALAFFWKYDQQIALLLGCYSLPYCYAAAEGAQVLWLSQRIKNDTFKRLEETGEFVFGIMQERDWPNARNLTKILKIRLMHAVVRYFTFHSGQWDNAWGMPVNQEDMAGTNLAFSYIVIKGLRKLGILISVADEEAYLHFWNVVGCLLGLEAQLLPQHLREAYHLDRAIAKRQFRASEAGTGLTKALMEVLRQQAPTEVLRNLPVAQMRFLLGPSVADLLEVPSFSWEEKVVKITTVVPIFNNLVRSNKSPSAVLTKYQRR